MMTHLVGGCTIFAVEGAASLEVFFVFISLDILRCSFVLLFMLCITIEIFLWLFLRGGPCSFTIYSPFPWLSIRFAMVNFHRGIVLCPSILRIDITTCIALKPVRHTGSWHLSVGL